MFNLKQVYAVLNFDRSKIKLLVIERTSEKMNCIYYDEASLTYLDDKINFVNASELNDKLVDLIKAADNFMGINIKRYIVNISCLPLEMKLKSSPKFLTFEQVLSWNHYNNYIDKIKKIGNSDEQVLHVNPKKWMLDNNQYDSFPLSQSGSEISFQYYVLSCKRSIIQQWYDLFDFLKIKILKITNNSIGWTSLFHENKENIHDKKMNNVVIDIKSRNSIITIYDNAEIIDVLTCASGSNEILDDIRKTLKLPSSTNISQVIHSLTNLNYVNEPITLINKYSEQFLEIQEANSYDVKKCLGYSLKRFLINISSIISSTNYQFTKIWINANDELFEPIKLINLDLLKLPYKYELITNDIIGLEEKNVCGLLCSINYVYYSQTTNEFKFSIDEYVSQEISISQTKQNFLLKLGLISTKWAAKLGE